MSRDKINKPHNLLYEVLALGMQAGIAGSYSGNPKVVAIDCENEMDRLAKLFGFSGFEAFDKYFEGEKNAE